MKVIALLPKKKFLVSRAPVFLNREEMTEALSEQGFHHDQFEVREYEVCSLDVAQGKFDREINPNGWV